MLQSSSWTAAAPFTACILLHIAVYLENIQPTLSFIQPAASHRSVTDSSARAAGTRFSFSFTQLPIRLRYQQQQSRLIRRYEENGGSNSHPQQQPSGDDVIGPSTTSRSQDQEGHHPGKTVRAPNDDSIPSSKPKVQESVESYHSLSLSELLSQLIQHNVRFSPTAERWELEQLLWHAQQSCSQSPVGDFVDDSFSPPDNDAASKTEQHFKERSCEVKGTSEDREAALRRRRRREQRARHQQQQQSNRFSGFGGVAASATELVGVPLTVVPQVAAQTYHGATRKWNKFKRKVSEYLYVDDDGIRDVDYQYLYRDEAFVRPSSRTAGPVVDSSTTTYGEWRTPRRRRPQHDDSPTNASTRRRQNRRRHAPQQQGTMRPNHLLPPAIDLPMESTSTTSDDTTVHAANPAPQSSADVPPPRKKRKIYSPYAGGGDNDDTQRDDAPVDELDRLGNFVADVADRFMWGPEDNDSGSNATTSDDTPSSDTEKKSKDHPTPKHWKDRLEEQFDGVLGLNDGMKSYNRWTEQAKYDKDHEGPRDAFSVARGVQPKRHGLYSRRKQTPKVFDKPIWEEEGNLISLLFGRTQSGQSLLFEKLLDPNHGSLLFLLRAVFRTFMVISSYMCRWASVRGAFPQPVVVLGVFTALVCAPRRRRLLAVTTSLLLFRTLGELLHGYTYGNDGWEDDAGDDDDDDDAESDEPNHR